jgi:hypothetical protein
MNTTFHGDLVAFVRDAATLSETETEKRIRDLVTEARRLPRSSKRSLLIRYIEDLAHATESNLEQAAKIVSNAFEAARAEAITKDGASTSRLALIVDEAPDPAETPAIGIRAAFEMVNRRG